MILSVWCIIAFLGILLLVISEYLGHPFNVRRRVKDLEDAVHKLCQIQADLDRLDPQPSSETRKGWVQSVQNLRVKADKIKIGLDGCGRNYFIRCYFGHQADDELKKATELETTGNSLLQEARAKLRPVLPQKSKEQLRILEPEAEAVTRRRLNPSDPGKIQFYLHEKKLIYFMEKSRSLLPISGTAGMGKTNLLRFLRNKYKSYFHYVFFAGAACGVDLLQHVIFINLGLGPPPQTSDVPVAKIISSFLKEESFLLLLDDLQETLDLAAVGLPMPLGHRQKVIFTTRSQTIYDNTIHLQCLEEEDAWSLFRDKVGDEIIHAHPQIKHLAKKIVAECGGLPSTLCTVGLAMSSKRDVKEWRNAYDLLKMKHPPPSEIQGASRTTQLYDPNVRLLVQPKRTTAIDMFLMYSGVVGMVVCMVGMVASMAGLIYTLA